jgi:cyclin-dependent kinase 12/13
MESTQRAPWELSRINDYEKIERIGEGTYGEVFRARHYVTNEIVAVKKVKMPETMREGFPITAIREIKILKALDHANVVKLKEIAISAEEELEFKSIFLIFEFLEHDLQGLLVQLHEKKRWLSLGQVKSVAKQLLEAVNYLHKNNVLHRDVKASNMLINNKGEVKLADFGLARIFQGPEGHYTNRVITLWFRPPELLLGATLYGPEVDVWSVGCIIAELLYKRAILPGRTELDQLDLIFKLCGTPNEDNWPGVQNLPYWNTLKPLVKRASSLRQTFAFFDSQAFELIESMLKLNPKERITAEQALQSPWFASDPQPENLADFLGNMESLHEYTAKIKRQAKRESSFSNNLNAKLQSMTLQPSPNKPAATNSYFSFNGPSTEPGNKASSTMPTINIQGSSPGNFSPKARTPTNRPSRSPSPSSINASLKFTAAPQFSNPLTPMGNQVYFSAPQPLQQQQEFVPPNIPVYFAQPQPRTQSHFFPVPNKQNSTQFGQMMQVQPQLTPMVPVAQPPPQFSFPSAAVPLMYKPQPYQVTQSMFSQPVQHNQPFNVPPQSDAQQQYAQMMHQQLYQQNYQPHPQIFQGVPLSYPAQHFPHQYTVAEQAIHNDLSIGAASQNTSTVNNTYPSFGTADPGAVPKFSFPNTKPALFTQQAVPSYAQSTNSPVTPTYSPSSPTFSPHSPTFSPHSPITPTIGSESDSAPLDDSDDADYVPNNYKADKKDKSEPAKGVRSRTTKVP